MPSTGRAALSGPRKDRRAARRFRPALYEIAAWLAENLIRCELIGSLGAFHHGPVAVPLEHQGGDAPNVDLRYQNARLMKSPPGLPMTLGDAAAARVRLIVWLRRAAIRSSPT
jgi:hypothetical protein